MKNIKLFSILLASQILIIFNFNIAISAEIVPPKILKQKIKIVEPKIQNFLAVIRRATNTGEIRKAYEKAKFSPEEVKRLRELTSAPPYKTRLDIIFNEENKKAEAAVTNSSKKAAKAKMRANLKKRHKAMIKIERPMIALRQSDEGKKKETIISGPAKPISKKTPIIERLSSQSITPGQLVNVSGHYFGALKGKALFTIQGKKYQANIEFWQDDLISIRLKKGISGVKRTEAILTISNNYKHSVNYSVNFIPEMVERHIYKTWTLTVPAPAVWPVKRTKTYCDCKLKNDWQVAEFWITEKISGKAGCSYREKPTLNGDSPKAKVKLWAYGFSGARCTHNALIRGPKGFKPYQGSCCS